MKKKIVALCLVLALAVTAIAGATMAYFTDIDQEKNSFTVGGVDIDLVEEFEQNAQLMPGVENAITKEAKIVNEGEDAAYVWAEILIPAALDDGEDGFPNAPGIGNSLHFNFPAESTKEWGDGDWSMKHTGDGLSNGFAGTVTIDNVVYNKFVYLYEKELAADAETTLFLSQVYMDKDVTLCTDAECECKGEGYVLMKGDQCYTGAWEILVYAYAIQAEGFDDVYAARAAYDGAMPY